MLGRMAAVVLVLAACCGASSTAAAAEFLPLVNAGLMGGQSYYDGKNSSLSGNFSVDLVPAVRFGDGLSLLPRYSGAYNGNSLALEIEDESYLYQDVQDHAFAVKMVRRTPRGSIVRLSGGFMLEMLRETRDEGWGDGLYDYRSPYGELELAREFSSPRRLRAIGVGYRFYRMQFPNYESVASTQHLSLGGQNVIDNDNHVAFFFADLYTSRGALVQLRYDHEFTGYADQNVVLDDGSYSSGKRKDSAGTVEIDYLRDWPARGDGLLGQAIGTYFGLGLSFKVKRSNQNYYDSDLFTFVGKYYNYNRIDVTPALTFRLSPADVDLTFGYRFSSKQYPSRLTQDVDGYYQDRKLSTTTHEGNATVSYELARGFRLAATGAYQSVGSNTDYREIYSYSYKAAYAMLGVSYEY